MQRKVPSPDVVVVGGDLMAHGWRGLAHDAGEDPVVAAIATTREIAHDLGSRFPRARFLVALGNNDDPCGDYRSETGGAYARAIASIWAPLLARDGTVRDAQTRFERGGYYTADLPGERAIVLNSVFWSFANRSGCESNTNGTGASELRWLNDELEHLPSGEHAVIVMHVPPGYDPQTSASLARGLVAVPFFGGRANASVLETFATYRQRIAFAIGAHTHRYDFRIPSGVPMIVGSSISPVYGNNPAFFNLTVGADGRLDDVVPYVYDFYEESWLQEPGFDTYFGVHAIDAPELAALAQRIRTDDATRARWIQAHDAWAHMRHPPGWWLINACAQTELSRGFASCARIPIDSSSILPIAIGTIVLLALAGALGGAWLFRLRRRVDSRS
jgi:hypothetical protein